MHRRLPERPIFACLLLVISAMMWGSNITIGRGVHEDFPPIALTFWRNCAALILIGLIARHHWHDIIPAFQRQKWVVMLGSLFGIAGFNCLLYTAVQSTTAINAALSLSLTPAIIPALAFVILRESFNVRQCFGLALSFIGISIIIARGKWAAISEITISAGDILMLAATVAWSIYSVLVKKRDKQTHPLTFLTVVLTIAVVLLFPAYLFESLFIQTMPVTETSLYVVLYVGIFPTALALLLFNKAVDIVGPNIAGYFQHLVPIFASLWAIIFLDETLQVYHGLGGLLITIGLYSASTASKSNMTRL